jgi:transcription antitermination factor NusG
LEIDNRFVNYGSAWFAVFTTPRHEKKVAEHFQGRAIEGFLPTYNSMRTWKNRQKVNLAIPLFPSYIFARIQQSERGKVLGVPGVLSIVGTPNRPTPLPDHYIETLRTGTELRRMYPHPATAVGDRVRIVSGPLAGIEGVLAHVRSEFRVVLSIEMIRQCVSIDIGRDEIEPVVGNKQLASRGFGLLRDWIGSK